MAIRRVVPDITTDDLAGSRDFYTGLLGFDVGMDLGWVVTLVSPTNPTAQIILFRSGGSGPQPDMASRSTTSTPSTGRRSSRAATSCTR